MTRPNPHLQSHGPSQTRPMDARRVSITLAALTVAFLTGCPEPPRTTPPPPAPPRQTQQHIGRWTPPPPTRYPPLQPLPQPRRQWAPQSTQVVEVGRSVRGEPIRMQVFGTAPNPALVFGGIHGDEENSSVMAERLIALLSSNPELTARRSVAVIARANPDGLNSNTRANVNGVDLNRNFPASNWKQKGGRHGGSPLSEPESRAVAQAVRMLKPRVILSLHSIANGSKCNNYDGPAARIAQEMHRHNGYAVKDSIGYPTPGSFGTWAGADMGIPTITLEIAKNMSGDAGWAQNRQAILAALSF